MVTYIINMIANQDALHLHKIRVYRVKPIDLGINKTADAMLYQGLWKYTIKREKKF